MRKLLRKLHAALTKKAPDPVKDFANGTVFVKYEGQLIPAHEVKPQKPVEAVELPKVIGVTPPPPKEAPMAEKAPDPLPQIKALVADAVVVRKPKVPLRRWITNGVTSKQALIGDEIPEGWQIGRHVAFGKKTTKALDQDTPVGSGWSVHPKK